MAWTAGYSLIGGKSTFTKPKVNKSTALKSKTANYRSATPWTSGYVAPRPKPAAAPRTTPVYNNPVAWTSGYVAPKPATPVTGWTAGYNFKPYVAPAPYVAPRPTITTTARAVRPGGTGATSVFAVTASTWNQTTSARTDGAMGMSINLAHALANTLKRTRSALDDVIAIARNAATLSQINTPTSHIGQLADQAWSAGNQVQARANALDAHRVEPRLTNLATTTLAPTTSVTIPTNLPAADRALLNRAKSAATTDRVQGGTGNIGGANTNGVTNANDRHLFELNNGVADTGGTTGPGSGTSGGFDPGFNSGADGPVIDLNAAIAAVSDQFADSYVPLREVDVRTAQVQEVRDLWEQADRTIESGAGIPDYWGYAREGLDEQAQQLRVEAWEKVESFGGDPAVVLGAIVNTDASDRDIARATEIARAQRLHETANALTAPGFAFEVEQMRLDTGEIMADLFLTTTGKTVLDHFGSSLSPVETMAMIGYANIAEDGGQAVMASTDPMRVLQIRNQGYSEEVALDHVANAPTTGIGSKTFAELELDLATMEANNDTNRYEFDATLNELNRRTQDMSGEIYVRTDLEAVRIADRTGMGLTDVQLAILAQDLTTIDGPPSGQDMQRGALRDQMVDVITTRNDDRFQAALDNVGGSPDDQTRQAALLHQERARQLDVDIQVDRIMAMVTNGTPIGVAEMLSGALDEDATPSDFIGFTIDIDRLVDGGADFGDAANAVLSAHSFGLDADDIIGLATDESIDIGSASMRLFDAERRDMTIAELDAFNGFDESFTTFDTARGGEADNKASIEDVQYVADNPDKFTALQVANAIAFLSQERLMARLDDAADNTDVNNPDGFGSLELDDGLWSSEDLENFEFKQSINFALADSLEIIDTAGKGGDADGFLSQLDYQRALDNKDELGLTEGEVWAIENVINGDFYDKHWVERNKGKISLAAFAVGGPAAYLITNVGIDLMSDPDFASDVNQAIFNFSPTGIAANIAQDPWGTVKAVPGVVTTLGGAAYEIGKLTPFTPQGMHLLITDPGQFVDNQITFASGIKDWTVGAGKLVGALAIASNPISNQLYEEATGTNVQDEISNALLGAAEMAADDPGAFAAAIIDWEGLKEDPIKWAGTMAPEIVIEILTAGAASSALAARRGAHTIDTITDIGQVAGRVPTLTPLPPRIPKLEIPAGLTTPIRNQVDELAELIPGFRGDSFPNSPQGRTPDRLKSHIDAEGNLVPANPGGETTIYQHIRGSEPVKSDSPFTSFSTSSEVAKGYGDELITLDIERLRADIDAGKLDGVSIIDNDEILRGLDDRIEAAQTRFDQNPSTRNAEKLERAQMDRANVVRDNEYFVQGIIPAEYITLD